jgi:hypothetical protein
VIDLDGQRELRAAQREGAASGLVVRFAGTEYQLPPELPAAVLDPVLGGQVDLTELVRLAAVAMQDSDDRNIETVVSTLVARPDLPTSVLTAVHAFLRSLFGERWAEFWAAGPSLVDLANLIAGIFRSYGVGLGESFGLTGSSSNDGQTSSPTSNGSTPSMPGGSGAIQALATS